MHASEYTKFDGLGLAELVAKGETTPTELLEIAIQQIETHNETLNAVVRPMYDEARAAVAQGLPNGPFRGVPFLLKDLLAMVEGVPTSNGNRLWKNIPAPHDSEFVRRLKAAGLMIAGKTNTPEFGIAPVTEPDVFGPARNPWDTERTPGGSSGGSAAAVASGMVPFASGGDGGGSIRIPASCCGLFGLKPTRGRVPIGPDIGEAWNGYAIEHVITRSVRDSAAVLDAVAGADVGAPYAAPPAPASFLAEVAQAPGNLRIAFTSQPFLSDTVHEDCVTGLHETVQLLEGLGHHVEEAAPPVDTEATALAFMRIIATETWADMAWTAEIAGRSMHLSDFDRETFGLGLIGKTVTAVEYTQANRSLQMTARRVGAFFENYDVLLTPTLGAPPVRIGELQTSDLEKMLIGVIARLRAAWLFRVLGLIEPLAAKTYGFIPYTPLFNITGQPAMSVPLHWNAQGLPIGMQFVGKFGNEATLYRLAGQLEQAKPWFDRRAPGFSPRA